MRRVTELLVPQGTLTVEQVFQVFQEFTGDGGEVAALAETLRRPYLNGEPVYWGPGTRDLLAAASDALALLPLPLPLIGPGS